MSSRGPYILASVSRTVRTVELVAASGAMRLAELAACLGVSRPGAFRIAQTLVAHRWLVQGDDRRYRIGPAARALTGLAADVDGDGERA
ncbi:helix-turn-helix domain-containing protein [Cellulosimicrobium composti]|nr:helix-turn-helix domain-containing protein [Cellulosimicrobium composti]